MKRTHTISFKHAAEGLMYAIKSQPNFRVHLFFTSLALGAGYLYTITRFEWLILTLTITMVIVVELLNTAIEAVVDLLTEQHNRYAKIAKDVAAASVLCAAAGSVIIGLLIFLPKIL